MAMVTHFFNLITLIRPFSLIFLAINIFSLLTVVSRIGGFAAFVIYMITIFSLYVPDWSFVAYDDNNKPQRYTVMTNIFY